MTTLISLREEEEIGLSKNYLILARSSFGSSIEVILLQNSVENNKRIPIQIFKELFPFRIAQTHILLNADHTFGDYNQNKWRLKKVKNPLKKGKKIAPTSTSSRFWTLSGKDFMLSIWDINK